MWGLMLYKRAKFSINYYWFKAFAKTTMEEFTLNQWAVHARSKKEVYELLVIQGNVILPQIQEWDHQLIKAIIQGNKQVTWI